MPRNLSLFVAGLITSWAMMLPGLGAGEPKELKIIASASDPEPVLVRLKREDSGVVIRSPAELAAHSAKPASAKDPAFQMAMETALAKLLKVKNIDWSKHMVLIVQGHATRGDRGTIKFGSPKSEGKFLTVPWKQENRVSLATYLDPPMGFALVERSKRQVKFVAPAKK